VSTGLEMPGIPMIIQMDPHILITVRALERREDNAQSKVKLVWRDRALSVLYVLSGAKFSLSSIV
jgi:hypothetical protein